MNYQEGPSEVYSSQLISQGKTREDDDEDNFAFRPLGRTSDIINHR